MPENTLVERNKDLRWYLVESSLYLFTICIFSSMYYLFQMEILMTNVCHNMFLLMNCEMT